MTRDEFEEILGAMARANFLRLVNAVFEKDGKAIPYRKASLTPDGEALEEIVAGDLLMKDAALAATKARKGRKKKAVASSKARRSRKPAAVRHACAAPSVRSTGPTGARFEAWKTSCASGVWRKPNAAEFPPSASSAIRR